MVLMTALRPDGVGAGAKSLGYGAVSGSIAMTMVGIKFPGFKPNFAKCLSLVLDYKRVS